MIAAAIRAGTLATEHLRQAERRRELPTRGIQGVQLALQRRVIARVLEATAPLRPPLALRIAQRIPLLQRILGRLIGLGIRPEHVKSPSVPA